ncbi:MAG: ribosomal protein L7/L12 [Candidatus Eisenbacteria bacterium]|jgi:ribosomal protein L7/L12|nr:ribosomal protein L7/L12 [Candidatus Eisenbacteria bacterium]
MTVPFPLAAAVVVIIAWLVIRARGVRTEHQTRRSGIHRESPTVLRPAEVPCVPAAAEDHLKDLLSRRKKIAAIKLVREATGWGLKHAKAYVEWRMDPRRPMPDIAPSHAPAQAAPEDLDAEVRRLVSAGCRLDAVRHVVDRTGWPLKKAVGYVTDLDHPDESH